jgi:hypothetical protein
MGRILEQLEEIARRLGPLERELSGDLDEFFMSADMGTIQRVCV